MDVSVLPGDCEHVFDDEFSADKVSWVRVRLRLTYTQLDGRTDRVGFDDLLGADMAIVCSDEVRAEGDEPIETYQVVARR